MNLQITLNPFILTTLLALLTISVKAQVPKKASVTGKVIENKTTVPLEFVAVTLLTAKDSVPVTNTMTNKEGMFGLQNISNGNYVLKVSFVGYKVFKRGVVITNNTSEDVGTIILEAGIELNAVTVQGEVTAVKVKTDTTEFNAAAFKAAPDATVEDGLKKLPGVEVDKDGKITSNGEEITKVTVDGKEFFGNDPKMATKNLPHDAVKSYQVINDKNDKSKDTGVDDGKRSKTLNIVLKDDKKKGYFGNGSLAGGTKDRYLGSLSLNRFTQDKQFNVLMMSNNVNQTGFTSEDANNFGGGSGGGSSYSVINGNLVQTSGNGVNVGNASQGLNKTLSGGVNFSDAWGKKNDIKFSGSYFASGTTTLQESESNTQSTQVQRIQDVVVSKLYFSNSLGNSNNSNQSHRVSVRLTAKIDSLTNLTFTPAMNLGFRNSDGFNQSSQSDSVKSLINTRSGLSSNDSFTPALTGSLNLTRRFHNKNGSVYFSVYGGSNGGSTDNITQSLNTFYQSGQAPININQLANTEMSRDNIRLSAAINRAISKDKKTSVTLTPSVSFSTDNTDRNTLEYNPANGMYEIRLDSLTNISSSTTSVYSSSLGFNKSKEKWNFNFSSDFQTNILRGGIIGNKVNEQVSKNFFNIVPEIYVTYRPKPTTSFSINLYGYNNLPRISDLVYTQNNSNPLYLRFGNPDLKTTRQYYAYISYNSSNTKAKTFTNISVTYSKTFDDISQQSTFEPETGKTTSKPVNVDGSYRMSARGSFTIPTKIAGLRLSPNLNFNNSRNVSFLNGVKNNSDQTTPGGGISVSYAYKEAVNITLTNTTRFTHIDNSTSTTINNNYFTLDNGANLSLEPIKKWRINADLVNRKAASQNFVLLNAGIQRFFMDKNKLSLELKGFDLLNNNSDVMRYNYETSIVDMRSNNLKRYFYLKLVYRVNKVGASAASKVPATPSVIIMR